MSLIDEALKRARQEAARQDEAARELRYRQVPVIPGLRAPARRPWLLPVVIAALLAVGIGIGFGLSLFRGDGEEQRAAVLPPVASPVRSEPPAEAIPAPAVPEQKPSPLPTPPPVVVEEKPAPPPVEEKQPKEDPAITDMRQREIALSPPRETQPAAQPAQAEPAPAPAPATQPAPQPAAPAPAAEPGEVKTYQQELPLAGGGTLRLNGIAYSEQPVALFGDKVVGPGESVAGYKVVAIEARRVRLEGPGGVVVVVEMQ